MTVATQVRTTRGVAVSAPRVEARPLVSQLAGAGVLVSAVMAAVVSHTRIEDPRYASAWLLPIAFAVCYVGYLHAAVWRRPSPLRVVFVVGAYLRYVASPVLIGLTHQYGTWAKTHADAAQVGSAVTAMTLELVACTLVLVLFDARTRRRAAPSAGRRVARADRRLLAGAPQRLLPAVLVGVAALGVSAAARAFFTIPVLLPAESFDLDLKGTSAVDEVAIILAITAKHLAFLAVLIWAWRGYDRSGHGRYVWIAMAAALANSVVFFGTNRLTTIFVALSSILAYCLAFPRHRLRLFLLAIPGLYGVYGFMTTARNYWDPYAAYSGLEHTLRNAESLINHYLGGVHNVAIAVKMSQTYAADAGLSNLAFDLLRPVPVLNTLVKSSSALTSNQYFNMEFYQSFKMDVILPSVGQGYFYFGPWLAWLIPAGLLTLGLLIERWMADSLRLEYIYLSGFVLMRFGTLMGSNATIQANELAIQFVVPVVAVWLLTDVHLRREPGRRVAMGRLRA